MSHEFLLTIVFWGGSLVIPVVKHAGWKGANRPNLGIRIYDHWKSWFITNKGDSFSAFSTLVKGLLFLIFSKVQVQTYIFMSNWIFMNLVFTYYSYFNNLWCIYNLRQSDFQGLLSFFFTPHDFYLHCLTIPSPQASHCSQNNQQFAFNHTLATIIPVNPGTKDIHPTLSHEPTQDRLLQYCGRGRGNLW